MAFDESWRISGKTVDHVESAAEAQPGGGMENLIFQKDLKIAYTAISLFEYQASHRF